MVSITDHIEHHKAIPAETEKEALTKAQKRFGNENIIINAKYKTKRFRI